MKVIIAQPYQEEDITQLRNELETHSVDLVLFPESYIKHERLLKDVCELANVYKTIIVTGYKDSNNKDRGIIINRNGHIELDKPKTPVNESLYDPLVIQIEKMRIGYLLCMEILKGIDGFRRIDDVDIIFHPIGVGMFSDDQFEEWLNTAIKIAKTYKTKIIGTSHRDGSYRNCGVSIPIAYYIDEFGDVQFISKSNPKTVVIDL